MFEFKLPDIGEGLSEGELLEWRVKVGDRVEEGQEVAEISTDKVAVALPSPRAGTIVELAWKPGDVVPVGAVLLRMLVAGAAEGGDGIAPTSRKAGEASRPDASRAGHEKASPVAASSDAFAVRASPALRRYAQDRGVDLQALAKSVGARDLTRADVDAHMGASAASVAGSVRRQRLTGARLAAAQRLAQSSRTLATTTVSANLHVPALATMADATSDPSAGSRRRSPLACIAHALCRALLARPRFNATIDESANELLIHDVIHLGLAVDAPAGLLVPVVKNAERLSIDELTEHISGVARAARDGTIDVKGLQGATFTLSSTGGVERVQMTGTTPLINLPNVATLWVSRVSSRPFVVDGKLAIAPVLACSLSFDHRHIHGAEAIGFLNDFDASLRALVVG